MLPCTTSFLNWRFYVEKFESRRASYWCWCWRIFWPPIQAKWPGSDCSWGDLWCPHCQDDHWYGRFHRLKNSAHRCCNELASAVLYYELILLYNFNQVFRVSFQTRIIFIDKKHIICYNVSIISLWISMCSQVLFDALWLTIFLSPSTDEYSYRKNQ